MLTGKLPYDENIDRYKISHFFNSGKRPINTLPDDISPECGVRTLFVHSQLYLQLINYSIDFCNVRVERCRFTADFIEITGNRFMARLLERSAK